MKRLDQEKDPKVLHQAIELLQHHNRALAAKIAELLCELAEANDSICVSRCARG